jgi:hypothetical protein
VNADALGLVLALGHATTEADAMALITAALLAGLPGALAQQAFTTWHAEHARSVQVIGTSAPVCVCLCGPSVHTGGFGRCFSAGCTCQRFQEAS